MTVGTDSLTLRLLARHAQLVRALRQDDLKDVARAGSRAPLPTTAPEMSAAPRGEPTPGPGGPSGSGGGAGGAGGVGTGTGTGTGSGSGSGVATASPTPTPVPTVAATFTRIRGRVIASST